MRDLNHLNQFRQAYQGHMGDHGNGAFNFPIGGVDIHVIASNGLGWDHVSVSTETRCPTWEEMCVVKDLFFEESETVVQYHPAKADYVNHHPYCLHLWRPLFEPLPKPFKQMIGPKDGQVEFTESDIATVRAAIRRAKEECDEWERASRVSPERMRTPLTPPRRR